MLSDKLLQKYKLSRTNVRAEILDLFIKSSVAMSMNELKTKMSFDCDRVTLYRNLKTFTEKGLLHIVYLDKQDSKYVLPDNVVNPKAEYSEHLHFKCINCQMVKCLTDQQISSVVLPEGYKMLEANFVVYGYCNDCGQDKQQEEQPSDPMMI